MDRIERISADQVGDLALGAAMLAAGGGAPPWPAVAPLRRVLATRGPVPLVAAADLAPAALVLPIGVLDGSSGPGSSADGDGFPAAEGIRRVVRAAEQRCGRPCAAVVPLEIAGVSALAAVYAAAELGLPCVDADGTRRGFPRLDLTLFGIGGLTASPAFVSDATGGNLVTVESPDNRAADRLVQAAAADLHGVAAVCAYPMSAADCARAAATGSLSYCAGLGAAAAPLRDGHPDRLSAYGARLLFTGQVVHVARNDAAGPARGTATVESLSAPMRTMRIDFQQGNLVASEDGVVRTTVPDLISLVDMQSLRPASADGLAAHQLVHVLAIPADERWRSPAGLAAAGPRVFGYDIDYEPFASAPVTPSGSPLVRPDGRHHPLGLDNGS